MKGAGMGKEGGFDKLDPTTALKDVREKGSRRSCHLLNFPLILDVAHKWGILRVCF